MLDSIRFHRFSFYETLDREKLPRVRQHWQRASKTPLTAPAFDQAAVTALAQRAHYAAAAAALECIAARPRAYEQRNLKRFAANAWRRNEACLQENAYGREKLARANTVWC